MHIGFCDYCPNQTTCTTQKKCILFDVDEKATPFLPCVPCENIEACKAMSRCVIVGAQALSDKYDRDNAPDKFVTEHPLPEGSDREYLTILIEEVTEVALECNLVIQRATKALRFGVNEIQGGEGSGHLMNGLRLSMEVGHLLAMIERLKKRGIVMDEFVTAGFEEKQRKLAIYMQSPE